MMPTLSPLLLHFIASAAASLIVGVAETAVLVLATALCLRVFPAVSAGARSRIWIGVFVVALILPLWPSAGMADSAGSPMSSPLHFGSFWAVGLVGAWGLLAVVRGIALVRSALHLGAVARRSLPLDEASFAKTSLQLHSAGCLGRKVVLCSSVDVDVPSVVGFFKPRVLLPASLLEKMSAEDLRQIVLHEMEHLRRHDDWTNLLQKTGLVLLPLSPVLFWVERRLCVERELACDDGVIQLTGASKAYATCLTNLAEQSLLHRGITLALSAWQKKSELSRRVLRLLQSEPSINPRRSTLSAAITLGIVAGCAVLLSRAPQFIQFGNESPVAKAAVPSAPATATLSNGSGGTGHITLARAVMTKSSLHTAAKSHAHRVARSMKSAPRRALGNPWLVLTDFHETAPVQRARQLVLEYPQFTYAAIPIRNGWLVIQL